MAVVIIADCKSDSDLQAPSILCLALFAPILVHACQKKIATSGVLIGVI